MEPRRRKSLNKVESDYDLPFTQRDREGFTEENFVFITKNQFVNRLASKANAKEYNIRDNLNVYSIDKRWLRDP